jgi:hypothetical protein
MTTSKANGLHGRWSLALLVELALFYYWQQDYVHKKMNPLFAVKAALNGSLLLSVLERHNYLGRTFSSGFVLFDKKTSKQHIYDKLVQYRAVGKLCLVLH